MNYERLREIFCDHGFPLALLDLDAFRHNPAFYLFAAVNIINLPLVAAMLRPKRERHRQ